MIEKIDVQSLTTERLVKILEHSVLKPTATKEDLRKGCEFVKKHNIYGIHAKPYQIKLASQLLTDSEVKVCAPIGFPHGAHRTETKVFELEQAILDGAQEIDMVMNIGALKSRNFKFVEDDIGRVVEKAKDMLVKVLIETCYLTKEEKITACNIAEQAGAHYVKTSTGVGTGGASVEDVRLIYETVGSRLGVKAAGGIRSLDTVFTMIEAGATRIGAASTEAIIQDWERRNMLLQ